MSGYSAVFKQANKKESPNHKRQHIRFDQEEEEEDDDDHQKKKDGDGVITSSSKATTTAANNDLPSSNNSQKRKKKRKRSATTTPSDNDGNNVTTTNKHQDDKIFNGLILALSTDNKQHQSDNNNSNNNNNNKEEDDPYNNLKSLKTILQSHGATISPQVHKRVHYLICTPCAITNLTQRIRQAMKRNVDIVSVDWVKKCVDEKRRVDVATSESDEKYLWNDWAREIMVEKECENKKTSANNNNSVNSNNNDDEDGGYDSDNIPQEDDDDNRGWSTPVQLDCCCVCHENGDLNCPWCGECNINLALKKTTKEEENI